MLVGTPSHEIIRSNSQLETLHNDWKVQDKSRIYMKSRKLLGMKTESTKSATQAATQDSISNGMTVTSSGPLQDSCKSTSIQMKRKTPSALASLQSVFASRKDLPEERTHTDNIPDGNYNKTPHQSNVRSTFDSAVFAENESKHVTVMGDLETRMMIHVCDTMLATTPPYSTGTSPIGRLTPQGNRGAGCIDEDSVVKTAAPVASTCCAQIRTNNGGSVRNTYLPISSPSPGQIAKCQKSTSYNSNIQKNIVTALTAANVCAIIRSTGSQTIGDKLNESVDGKVSQKVDANAVYMDTNVPVQSLATPKMLEGIIFGDSCITSSDGFVVSKDIAINYARAIEAFQEHGSTRIGEHLVLSPSFWKKKPMVVSLSCPSLNRSHIVTGFSAVCDNETLGPNHPIREVEVMSKLVPFINKCCEEQMGFSPETVEDLEKDKEMPIATTSSIEHCFAYEPNCGVSVYVGSHVLNLDTEYAQTYRCPGEIDSPRTKAPTSQQFVVHVSAIFSGTVTNTKK